MAGPDKALTGVSMVVKTAADPAKPAPDARGAAPASNIALQDIWNGIAQDQFFPHYQPKVVLKGMEMVGVEALMRWQHPEYGLLSAGTFLHLVADNFLFDDLTAIMLEKSISQCHRWLNHGIDVTVSVNLSPDLLLDLGLADRIEAKVIEHSVAHENIIIEIPESVLASEVHEVMETLLELHSRGFGLAIDDYGTGHCTRRQLARIPANELKIDRKMLAGAARSQELRAALVDSLNIARDLNLKAVAEGVENQEEWDLVNELGCDMAQGYFIARPMAGEDLIGWHEVWSSDPFV
jgi:EAL domain-containing protein (putative c-di-GMP-specific phosphodiesterase class I)